MTTDRKLSVLTGISYLIIFFTAIFANFFVIEAMLKAPLASIQQHQTMVRLGIMAFLITVVFDVIIAWTLYVLYRAQQLSKLSTYFRLMHAAIMGIAIFALVEALDADAASEVLHQVHVFNTIWLIGLFFFGIHLMLLATIIKKPKLIAVFLGIAGIMYMVDTTAHIVMPHYEDYKTLFLALVAIPSIVGEMSFALWLLIKGGKTKIP